MEYMKIRKKDSNIVPCVKSIPEKPKGIVIAIHGFSSSKECATYQMLLRRLPEAGYGMIGIELPDTAGKKHCRKRFESKAA